jgi:AMP phosphorylase
LAPHAVKGRFRVRVLDITAGLNIILLNEGEAHQNDIYTSDRVMIEKGGRSIQALVDVTSTAVKPGEAALFEEAAEKLGVRNGDEVKISQGELPVSVEFIKRKMDGAQLSQGEIDSIIGELMENKLSDVELASFITSLYIRGLNTEETVSLTRAIVKSGDTLDLGGAGPIVDKHCTGGVAGNRTTMLIVPIVAAAGLYMPKTSSRSITSAAGTADTMEVLTGVEFSIEELKKIVLDTHGCIVWGGAVNLAAADDRLIQIRHPMRLDPKGVMVASVLAKKKSVGAEYVVIDIPVGRGAKIQSMEAANDLAREFIVISAKLGMKSEVLITYGRDPVGKGIGPALECADVLDALQGRGPADLAQKSCRLAGAVMELCGKVDPGRGFDVASDILRSGKAYAKMKEIIEAQGGDPNVKVSDLPVGRFSEKFFTEKEGRIHLVDNHSVNRIARAAGAPESKGAGMRLYVESGDKVKKGDLLYEIVAESESKLSAAMEVAGENNPIELETVILGKMGESGLFQWKPKV